MFTPWQVRLLGGFCLERQGEKITRLRSQKTVALLAYLCHHAGRDCGREELVAQFWPDADLEAGQVSLRVALSYLRKTLEPPPTPACAALTATRTHVTLRPAAVVCDTHALEDACRRKDTDRVRALVAAGPLLPGNYDEWVLAERERLEALVDAVLGDSAGLVTPAITPVEKGTAPDIPHNLPLTLTRFFGRETEVSRLEMCLLNPQVRLVTLTGAGGTGKTRLAVETASNLVRDKAGSAASWLGGGVWFVPLAALTDAGRLAAQLPLALRDALGLPPAPGNALAQVAAHLSGQRAIFILDNLEQVADGATVALPLVLQALPTATLLVTSRVRTGISGEQVVALSPLPLPPVGAETGDIAASEAVALFADRARNALADFALTPRNAADVAALVTWLEGVPLALELAAAWVNVLTPGRMREQLEARRLAGDGVTLDTFPSRKPGERPARHHSVRAAISYSYDLLPPDLRRVFVGLSVFRGGFGANAAAPVCEEPSIHAALSRLHACSLLTVAASDTDDEVRFAFLEAVREFACEEATQNGTLDALQTRHADHFLDWAIKTPQRTRRADLARERDNLFAALDCFDTSAANEIRAAHGLVRLTRRLWRFWYAQGLWDEARTRLERAAACVEAHLPPHPDELGDIYRGLGVMAFYQGEHGAALVTLERAVAFYEARNLSEPLGPLAADMGGILLSAGRVDAAIGYLRRSVREAQAATARTGTLDPDLANRLHNLGEAYLRVGRWARADVCNRKALALPTLAPESRGLCLAGLGDAALRRGDPTVAADYYEQARTCYEEAGEVARYPDIRLRLAQARLAGGDLPGAAVLLADGLRLARPMNNRDHFWGTFEALATLALQRGDLRRAAQFFGAAQTLREEMGVVIPPSGAAEHAGMIQALAPYDAALRDGAAWPLPDALDFAAAYAEKFAQRG